MLRVNYSAQVQQCSHKAWLCNKSKVSAARRVTCYLRALVGEIEKTQASLRQENQCDMLQRFLNVCKQTETSSEKSDRHPKKVEGSRAFEGIRIHRMPKQAWEAFFQIPESTASSQLRRFSHWQLLLLFSFSPQACTVKCLVENLLRACLQSVPL